MAEKVFIREKESVKITVNYMTNSYSVRVEVKELGKRKWNKLFDRDDWDYRRREFPHGRIDFVSEQQLKKVTIEEIYEVCVMEWESLKPFVGIYDVPIY